MINLIVCIRAPACVASAQNTFASSGNAGIYSTNPGTVGRGHATPKRSDEVSMSMTGIVPTEVTAENGPIHSGDLMRS